MRPAAPSFPKNRPPLRPRRGGVILEAYGGFLRGIAGEGHARPIASRGAARNKWTIRFAASKLDGLPLFRLWRGPLWRTEARPGGPKSIRKPESTGSWPDETFKFTPSPTRYSEDMEIPLPEWQFGRTNAGMQAMNQDDNVHGNGLIKHYERAAA
ncbi:hypothetical protein E4U14_000160 [Claviceps sp. LM454 group G7]|nr:hypothetical protein E4U14_000160 [Claviceps sp. LM454 group G7]